MKQKLFSKLTAAVLALVMLLPCMMAPASAANVEADVLYSWKAVGEATKNMEAISDNLRMNEGRRTDTHKVGVFRFTTGAQRDEKFTGYYLMATARKNYGLPYAVYETSVKTEGVMDKPDDSLELIPNDFPVVITRGKAAINLKMTYVQPIKSGTSPLFALDMFRVQVTLDGKEWLDGAGIRSWKLIGGAEGITNKDGAALVFEIQSENLLEIEGLKEGDRIRGIRILPHGEFYYSMGRWFILKDMTLNGYYTKEAFETAVPNERDDLLYIGEEKMRDITVEHGVMIGELDWVSDADIYTDYAGVATTEGGRKYCYYGKGLPHKGPTYSRNSKIGYELFRETIVDGKYIAGKTTGGTEGYDCFSYVYDCYGRVCGSFSWVGWQVQSDGNMPILGNIKTNSSPVYTDKDIYDYNDEQTILEGLALLKRGDIISTNSVAVRLNHIKIAKYDAVVVRNADGTINAKESYVRTIEQGSTPNYWFRKPDGSLHSDYNIRPDTLQEYMDKHPTYEFLYAQSARTDGKSSFAKLLADHYIPLTTKEYLAGAVEDIDVQMILQPKDGKDVASGFRVYAATDYHVGRFRVWLEDLTTGEVLYDFATVGNGSREGNPGHQLYYTFAHDDAALDKVLAGLTNGKYRVNASVLAGPVTEIRADRPTTVRSYDFAIENKAPSAPVTLSVPANVTAGQIVTVAINTAGTFDAADVEVKFDTDTLTFKNGTVTPTCMAGDVSGNKGIVRILTAGANGASGELAKLTFEAKKDAATADILEVKSAALTKASAADTDSAVKAVDGMEVHASINFADVASNAWYRDAVDFVVENGIMSGYNASTFGSGDKLSRAMVVQVLYNKENKPATDAEGKFPDVKSGDWYYNATRWGAAKGVVSGYGDGRFGPNDNVTIEQVAVILHNYMGKPAGSADLTSVGKYDDWAAGALQWAVANGVLKNVPFTNATETATRAQTAQMLMNYLNK